MNKRWIISAASLVLLLGLAACDAKKAPSGTSDSISRSGGAEADEESRPSRW
ncbi:hypothetical protein ABEX25_01470 [Paenibacillus thiaminolyticus]|uniref:hypothetical protein n=1 Tax=Paenibacillus thiaminolyticus TaxID=49283 RepID=UPI003D2A4F12